MLPKKTTTKQSKTMLNDMRNTNQQKKNKQKIDENKQKK